MTDVGSAKQPADQPKEADLVHQHVQGTLRSPAGVAKSAREADHQDDRMHLHNVGDNNYQLAQNYAACALQAMRVMKDNAYAKIMEEYMKFHELELVNFIHYYQLWDDEKYDVKPSVGTGKFAPIKVNSGDCTGEFSNDYLLKRDTGGGGGCAWKSTIAEMMDGDESYWKYLRLVIMFFAWKENPELYMESDDAKMSYSVHVNQELASIGKDFEYDLTEEWHFMYHTLAAKDPAFMPGLHEYGLISIFLNV